LPTKWQENARKHSIYIIIFKKSSRLLSLRFFGRKNNKNGNLPKKTHENGLATVAVAADVVGCKNVLQIFHSLTFCTQGQDGDKTAPD
jgi:hypothetical protein